MRIPTKRKGGYICSECFSTNTKIKGIYNMDYVNMVTCKKCGFIFPVFSDDIIDKGIIETIAVLNKKGYSTKFSCAGHNGNLNDNEAYIYFRDGDLLFYTAKYYPIPDTWEIDDRFTLSFIIRSNYKKKSRLNDIYKWALSLPELPTVIPFLYGYSSVAAERFKEELAI